jgi:hypothetical protein
MDYYFQHEDSEVCYSLEYFLGEMRAGGLTEMDVYKAKKYKDADYFFCRAVQECGEKGGCGSDCKDYAPRNGKSGCCKHYSNALFEPDVLITIKI